MRWFGLLRAGGAGRLAMAAIAAASLASCAAGVSRGAPGAADLILTNARVYTVEPDLPWAEAVAIGGGRILAVGSAAELGRLRGPGTRSVDLGGRLARRGAV